MVSCGLVAQAKNAFTRNAAIMLHRAMIGNECDRRTFNLPGGIGLASSLSERESDLEAPVAPGLRRIGLLTKVVALIIRPW